MLIDDIMNQCPTNTDPGLMVWLPLFGLLALCLVYYRALRTGLERSKKIPLRIIWAIPFFVALLLLVAFGSTELYVSGYEQMFACVCMTAVGGIMPLLAPKLSASIEGMGARNAAIFSAVRDVMLLIVIVLLSFLIIETPWNDRILFLYLFHVVINLALIAAFYLALYAFGGRRGSVLCLGIALSVAIGFGQYFVALFKGTAILPGDLLALGTAAAVSGGYTYEIGAAQVIALGLAMLAVGFSSFVQPISPAPSLLEKKGQVYWGVHAGVGLAIAFSLLGYVGSVSFIDDLGLFENGFWDSLNTYRSQGFVSSFIALAQNQVIDAPDRYSEDEAREMRARWAGLFDTTRGIEEARTSAEAQFDENSPTVIAVMNESFSDLSIYNDLNAGYTGPTRIKTMQDALLTGYVYTSVLGGGTCNSEFEFLTGASMGYIGASNSPYVTHDLSRIDCLPKYFSSLGYKTVAIHPEDRSNWNRDTVYEQLGFDQFLGKESFSEDATVRHAGITDAETYDKILELLDAGEAPQFIFDVTMQNHGGYGNDSLPEDERLSYDFSWMDSQCARETSEYVSLIERSDRELYEFIEKLRQVDRPIVLMVFGDHQPWMGAPLNEATNPGLRTSDPAYYQRAYMTPYVLWANYDVAGNDQVSERKDLGINYLQTLLLDTIGAPLTEQHKASVEISRHLPIINGFAYFSADDNSWHALDLENDENPVLTEWEWVQYLNFGSKM